MVETFHQTRNFVLGYLILLYGLTMSLLKQQRCADSDTRQIRAEPAAQHKKKSEQGWRRLSAVSGTLFRHFNTAFLTTNPMAKPTEKTKRCIAHHPSFHLIPRAQVVLK
jgi:hypothetical protein